MTISYVSVTIGSVLSFMLLSVVVGGALSAFFFDPGPGDFLTALHRQALSYAQVATGYSQGMTLNPRLTYAPGQVYSMTLPNLENQNYPVFAPYISAPSPDPTSIPLALLVAPDGRLVASSDPSRFAAGISVSTLFAEQRQAVVVRVSPSDTAPFFPEERAVIGQALAGKASMGTAQVSSHTLRYAVEPVWNAQHQPIGAIFVQAPEPARGDLFSALGNALLGNLLLLMLVTPVGVFFGWITARGLVRRVRRLALATAQFAGGDYSQRIPATQHDEIGQLEQQFNQMAEQLVDTISRRQQLAEQNARLEERARISRELHDAIAQDLFSLRLLADGLQEASQANSSAADLRPQITLLEQTTGAMTREMRALLLELRPTQLERLDLAGALRQLAHAYSARLGIEVTADVAPVPLDVKTEHALLRIAQESLANAARHSKATRISLCLANDGTMVTLNVTDNGEGFAMRDDSERHGLGLRIMQERVAELHGTFSLTTAPSQGVRLAVAVPQESVCD